MRKQRKKDDDRLEVMEESTEAWVIIDTDRFKCPRRTLGFIWKQRPSHINGEKKNLERFAYHGKGQERLSVVCVYLEEVNTKDEEYVVDLEGSMRGMSLNWLRTCDSHKFKGFHQPEQSSSQQVLCCPSGRATATRKVLQDLLGKGLYHMWWPGTIFPSLNFILLHNPLDE